MLVGGDKRECKVTLFARNPWVRSAVDKERGEVIHADLVPVRGFWGLCWLHHHATRISGYPGTHIPGMVNLEGARAIRPGPRPPERRSRGLPGEDAH